MHRPPLLAPSLALVLATGALFAPAQESRADAPPPGHRGADAEQHAPATHPGDLVAWMGRLQYYVHKLGLAVAARNGGLQGYYVHEVEEVIEAVERIRELDGIEIGKLLKLNLLPAFEGLETAVESGDPGRVDAAYDALIAGCNKCHLAANRPYIRIVRRADNPYMQDFAPSP